MVVGLVVLAISCLLTSCAARPADDVMASASSEVASPGERSAPPGVVVFGDSLGNEARPGIETLLEGFVDVRVEAIGGIALCDVEGAVSDAVEDDRASLVVLQFSGNAMTPCMRPHGHDPSSSEYLDLYERAAEVIVEDVTSHGADVLFVGSPPKPEDVDDGMTVDDVYRAVALREPSGGGRVGFVDAGLAVADEGGGWTATLPCLPFETAPMGCDDGAIEVRASDRGHFCPGEWGAPDGVMAECLVWSSGAFRYAQAISEAIRAAVSTDMTSSVDARP